MNLDKISLTLYDLVAYLLPGYVLLAVVSVTEATFFGTTMLTLGALARGFLVLAVPAYFLGQICHTLGSQLRNRWRKLLTDEKRRLSPGIYGHVEADARAAYSLPGEGELPLNTLETFMLADSYIVASGGTAERDMLAAREGFFKASMVAFGIAAVVLLLSLFRGGVRFRVQKETLYSLGIIETLALVILALLVALLFRTGFTFFNRVKVNNTLLIFAALRSIEKAGKGDKSK